MPARREEKKSSSEEDGGKEEDEESPSSQETPSVQEVRRTAAELDGPPAAAPAATASARPAEPAMAPSVEARARLRSRLAAGHAEVERRRDEESRREERADKRERRDKRERKRRGRSHSRKGPAGERPREKAREAVALPGTLRAARKSRQAAELARRGSEGVGPPRGGREEPAAEGSGSFRITRPGKARAGSLVSFVGRRWQGSRALWSSTGSGTPLVSRGSAGAPGSAPGTAALQAQSETSSRRKRPGAYRWGKTQAPASARGQRRQLRPAARKRRRPSPRKKRGASRPSPRRRRARRRRSRLASLLPAAPRSRPIASRIARGGRSPLPAALSSRVIARAAGRAALCTSMCTPPKRRQRSGSLA